MEFTFGDSILVIKVNSDAAIGIQLEDSRSLRNLTVNHFHSDLSNKYKD